MSTLPKHIAIIMDGNGRWARKRFLPRIVGHRAGVDAVRKVVKWCVKRHIEVLSLFAFSSENWRRPPEEVSHLMSLFLSGLESEINSLHEHHVQLRFIGDRSRLSQALLQRLTEAESLTRENTGLKLLIAIDYGGQWDITQAMRQVASDVEAGRLRSAEITEAHIARYLSFADLPNPDLFIRTSGELRISNFMLWQLAYTELYFTPVLWPDFDEIALNKALEHFATRERRYGRSSEELNPMDNNYA